MIRSRFVTVFVAVLLGLFARSASAADILPGEAIGEDVVCVLWIDAEKLDAKSLRAAAKVLLGDVKAIDDSIGELEKMREAFVKAGGAGYGLVFRGPDANGRPPEPYVLVMLKDRTDPEAALEAMRKIGSGGDWLVKLSDRALVAAPPRWRPTAVEAGEKHKAFEKLLASSGDAPAKIVFIPNESLRSMTGAFKGAAGELDREMPGAGALLLLADQACAMKHIAITLTTGASPKLSLHAEAADAEGAKLLKEQVQAGTEGLKKMAEKLKTQGRGGAEAAPMLAALADLGAIDPKVEGNKLTLAVDGTPLKGVAGAIVQSILSARQRANHAVLASNIHQLEVAISAYAVDNNGLLPDKLEDVVAYVGGAEELAKLMKHPVTGEKVGVSYVKPAKALRDIERPSITALLFETRDGKIQADGVTGYADGHVSRGRPAAPPEDRKKE